MSASIYENPDRPPGHGTYGLLGRSLRFFFHHFYHSFAWTYDFVASAVSLGRWHDWIGTAVPFIQGERVLELGHGPGHLQYTIRSTTRAMAVGLDESSQMGRLARRRLLGLGLTSPNLVRGFAQQLPFPEETFDTVVATFPTEFIVDPATLLEIRRVMSAGGQFVVVPAAWITGKKLLDRAAAWLFRITHQTPEMALGKFIEALKIPLEVAGMQTSVHRVELKSSTVVIVVASAR